MSTAAEPIAVKPAANITAATLATMFIKKSSLPKAAPAATPAAAPSEPAPAEPGAAAPEEEITPPAEPAPGDPTETPPEEPAPGEPGAPGEEPPVEEPEAEPEPGEAQPAAMPTELAEAIAEAKAAGDKGKAKLLQRLHKLVDQRDTERNQRLALVQTSEQQAAEIQRLKTTPGQAPAAVNSNDPYASVPEIAAIDQELASAEAVLDWAEENADGGSLEDGKGGAQQYTAEQVKGFKKQAAKTLRDLTATRTTKVAAMQAEDNQARAQNNTHARRLYPWLTVKDSPERQEALRVLSAIPELNRLPGVELVLGRYIEGSKLEKSKAKPATPAAPAKPAASRTPPPVIGRPGAVAPKVNAPQAEATGARQQFKKSGKVSDLAKMFAANSQARQKAA